MAHSPREAGAVRTLALCEWRVGAVARGLQDASTPIRALAVVDVERRTRLLSTHSPLAAVESSRSSRDPMRISANSQWAFESDRPSQGLTASPEPSTMTSGAGSNSANLHGGENPAVGLTAAVP